MASEAVVSADVATFPNKPDTGAAPGFCPNNPALEEDEVFPKRPEPEVSNPAPGLVSTAWLVVLEATDDGLFVPSTFSATAADGGAFADDAVVTSSSSPSPVSRVLSRAFPGLIDFPASGMADDTLLSCVTSDPNLLLAGMC